MSSELEAKSESEDTSWLCSSIQDGVLEGVARRGNWPSAALDRITSALHENFIFSTQSLFESWHLLEAIGVKKPALEQMFRYVMEKGKEVQFDVRTHFPHVQPPLPQSPNNASAASWSSIGNVDMTTRGSSLVTEHPRRIETQALNQIPNVSDSFSSDTQPISHVIESGSSTSSMPYRTPDKSVDESDKQFQSSLNLAKATGTFEELLQVVNTRSKMLNVQYTGRRLGRGSFGEVVHGFITSEGPLCGMETAVKRIIVYPEGSEHSLRDIGNEIELLFELGGHSNLVNLYDVQFDPPSHSVLLLMEYCDGGSLGQFIARHPNLPFSLVQNFTAQILWGLFHLHENFILHRDLKPMNILCSLVEESNASTMIQLKIADFGCSKMLFQSTETATEGTGTPAYFAPEVALSMEKSTGKHRYGFKADVWSLGGIVLEMVTGQRPYAESSKFQILSAFMRGETPRIPDSLPEVLRDFLQRCLRINPAERSTVAELMAHPFVNVLWQNSVDDVRRLKDLGLWNADIFSTPVDVDSSSSRHSPFESDQGSEQSFVPNSSSSISSEHFYSVDSSKSSSFSSPLLRFSALSTGAGGSFSSTDSSVVHAELLQLMNRLQIEESRRTREHEQRIVDVEREADLLREEYLRREKELGQRMLELEAREKEVESLRVQLSDEVRQEREEEEKKRKVEEVQRRRLDFHNEVAKAHRQYSMEMGQWTALKEQADRLGTQPPPKPILRLPANVL